MMSSLMIASPLLAFAQSAPSSGEYQIILYDAETIARINAKPKATIPPPPPALTEGLADKADPKVLSNQIDEVILGIPVITHYEGCGKGQLEINVTVKGVKHAKGFIVADLHDDKKEDFLKWDKVVLRVRAAAKKDETVLCIPLTKPGEYAVAFYHDKNSNRKFDKGFLKIPKERFGMSMNPKFKLKAPEFEEAVFSVPPSGANISVNLVKSGDILKGAKS